MVSMFGLWLQLLWVAFFAHVAIASPTQLRPRQDASLANVPSSCVDLCSVFTTLQTRTSASDLCTTGNSNGLQSCANCLLNVGGRQLVNNDALVSSTQQAVNAFVSACNAASLPIPGVLISDPATQSNTGTGTNQSSNAPRLLTKEIGRTRTSAALGMSIVASLFLVGSSW
ncbi:hypothetical protein CPB86DRAFT_813213 [Serendipita vermifera]|nr:hypothetical protein CPB86DRAFT_813213 [Serendipita vermifera]